MSRYIRFGYILPRLVGVILLYYTVQFGAGYLLRSSVVEGGQAAIGARVELGKASVSLLDAKADLYDLAITNPQRPMENLLEAERVELDFETDSLLRRKAVAQRGSIRGLQFGTPREESGALTESSAKTTTTKIPAWIKASAKQTADAWVDDLNGKLTTDIAKDFQSVRLAEEMAKRWPARYEELRTTAEALRSNTDRLKADFYEARSNPLRNAELLKSLPQRIKSLQGQLDSIYQEIGQLPNQIAAEKAQVAEARRHDEALLARRFQVDQLDSDSFTTYLLGEQVTEPLTELISWIRWTRQMMPSAKPTNRATERDRGVDIRFEGLAARPDLLIRQLDIEGTAKLAGQPVALTGLLTNFTTQPALHSQPLKMELLTAGNLPLEVKATLDRTSDIAVDELIIDCRALSTPALSLGSGKNFALDMGPTTASLTISLRIEGERLSGDMQLIQHDVHMTPQLAASGSRLTGYVQKALEEGVGHLPSAATRVTLSGTLDRPSAKVWSTIGTAVAESLNQSVKQLAADESQRLIGESRQMVEGQLASLDQNVAQLSNALGSDLAGPGQVLQTLIGSPSGRGTLSFEQLGKQLPNVGSIFR